MKTLKEYFKQNNGAQETMFNVNQDAAAYYPDPRSLPDYVKQDRATRRESFYSNDRLLWGQLLYLAETDPQGGVDFAQNLLCFRIEGTRIVPNGQGGLRLEPVLLTPEEVARGVPGWRSREEFRAWADKYLGPKKELLGKLLGQLSSSGRVSA